MPINNSGIVGLTADIVKATVSGMERMPSTDYLKEYIHAVYDALSEINEGKKSE